MVDRRWMHERDEIIELLHRIVTDHDNSLPEGEARDILGPWVDDAARRAEELWWLVAKGSPPILQVTYRGRKALDMALANRGLQPHWFGGFIVHAETEYGGPIVLPMSYKPYNQLKEWALEQGVLTQDDIDCVARAPRREPEEPQHFRTLDESSFPGTRMFSAPFIFEDGHPFGGGLLDPTGHEGPYQVTATLTRRGAPDIAYMYQTDAYAMEGDSHLRLPEERRAGAVEVPSVVYTSSEGEQTRFELLNNKQGRLGQIRALLRAESIDDARRKAYRLLNPFLCDLSYRYDVPIQILQTNVVELTTLTVGGMKQDDFREKVIDLGAFLGSGLTYEQLPNYEFFTRLYREGANSSSVDYGFLCFYRLAEGIIELRRKRIMEQEGKRREEVPRDSLFSDEEIVEGDEASEAFPTALMGKSIWTAFKQLEDERVKIGHAFLHSEDPLTGYTDIISDRLEGEEQAGTRRAQARFIARRMLDSEFFVSDRQAEDEATD